MQDYRPLNPWGRAMPKAPALPEPACSLYVRSRKQGKQVRVGPKMAYQYLEPLMMQINKAAALGAEQDWCDARIVKPTRKASKPGKFARKTLAEIAANPHWLE